jgi:hypothetical protein
MRVTCLYQLIGWSLCGLFMLPCVNAVAQDSLKNLPEYSLPISNKKLVIAHCMTNIIRYKGHEIEDSGNPKYYEPVGNITAPLGGLTQVKVLSDLFSQNASLDETVEFEMRAAIKSGIDGFQFYYILGAPKWDDIIKAYFRVAEQKHINFKFAVCISHPKGTNETKKINEFASRINGIMNEVGHNNPHWLRTPDGRLVVYMWLGEQLADLPYDMKGLPAQFYEARAFKNLANAVHEKFACMYCINEQIEPEKLNHILDYFPSVWLWTLPYTETYIGQMVANDCILRRRTFTGSVFNDFYTSKLLKPGTWDMLWKAEDAVKAGLKHVERKYIATGLSYNFRKMLEFDIKQDVPIINVITWNDYPEGHHLAPEANHNEGFSILLNQYKSVWKDLPSAYDHDVAVVFFKKYKQNIKPQPYYIPLVKIEKNEVAEKYEDSVEVVTILPSKAQLKVNSKMVNIEAGLHSTMFASQPGSVNVQVIRNSAITSQFTPPEWITDKPFRTDRLTYSYSSEHQSFYHSLFGNFPIANSIQYNADSTDVATHQKNNLIKPK